MATRPGILLIRKCNANYGITCNMDNETQSLKSEQSVFVKLFTSSGSCTQIN